MEVRSRKHDVFRKLKRLLTTALVLTVLDDNHKFQIEVNAS